MPVDLRPFLELRHSPCLAEARAAVMLDARAELQANGFLLLTAEAPAVDAAAPSSTATASATAGAETPSSLLSGSANAAMFEAARQFFVAAESNPAVANAATSLQAAATRGYAAPLSENFASLVGTVGAANDVVSKFRVGPNPELDDLPPWRGTTGYRRCSTLSLQPTSSRRQTGWQQATRSTSTTSGWRSRKGTRSKHFRSSSRISTLGASSRPVAKTRAAQRSWTQPAITWCTGSEHGSLRTLRTRLQCG